MGIFVIGLNQKNIRCKTDILKLVEKYDYNFEAFLKLYNNIKKIIPAVEASIISTCLRFEIIFHSEMNARTLLKLIAGQIRNYFNEIIQNAGIKASGKIFTTFENDALNHLLRTAAGFESEDIGEIQVLGQIKDSFANCEKHKTTGKNIRRIFSEALKTVNKIRDKIPIFADRAGAAANIIHAIEKNLSLRYFDNNFKDISELKFLIIGTGKIIDAVLYKLRLVNCLDISIIKNDYKQPNRLIKKMQECDVIILNIDNIGFHIDNSCFTGNLNHNVLIFDLSICRNLNPNLRNNDKVNLYIVDDLINGKSARELNKKRRDDKDFIGKAETIIKAAINNIKKASDKNITANSETIIKAQTKIIESEFEKTINNLINSNQFNTAALKKLHQLKKAIIKKNACVIFNAGK